MAVTPQRTAPGARRGPRPGEAPRGPALSAVADRLPGWLRPPAGMVDATRWLFAILVLSSLFVTVPGVVASSDGGARVGALVAGVVLAASWACGYRRRRALLVMDLVDAVALMGLTAAGSVLGATFPVVFAALWFRSQYGSLRRGLLRAALFGVATAAAVPLWAHVSGHGAQAAVDPVLASIPTMILTVVVGRHLASAVQARERSAILDALQGSLGADLLATTDAVEIREIAWAAIARVREVMTGLRVIMVAADGRQLRSVRWSQGFGQVPETLPPDLMATLVRGDDACRGAPAGRAALDAAAGATCAWACVPLPASPGQAVREWLLAGSPGVLAPEALAAVTNLANQVTLALRNSAVHRDLTTAAEIDALTALANRTTFTAALAHELADAADRETTVLFLDLDDFKDVNDVHGHLAGDELLRVVAARLREAVRPPDLCARIGGDEFAVLLRDTGEAVAAQVAARVVEAVSAPASLGAVVVHVGVSVGSATLAGAGEPETVLHRADVAMYAAKAQGKARVQLFDPSLLQGRGGPGALVAPRGRAAQS